MNAAILDKIRKLRALASSANVHEAAAAASAAERLIQEHNLSEASIHADSGEGDESIEGVPVGDVPLKVIPTWTNSLLVTLCRAYQCSGFFSREGGAFRFVAYGRPADLDTLRYQYAFFATEISRLTARASRGKGRTYANCFRLGAVAAIREALEDARRVARAAAVSSALVVVDRRAELARERRDGENAGIVLCRPKGARLDRSAFHNGKRAGAGINQRSQIAASGARLLGSG